MRRGLYLRAFAGLIGVLVSTSCGPPSPPASETSTTSDETSPPPTTTSSEDPTTGSEGPATSSETGTSGVDFVPDINVPGPPSCDVYEQDCDEGEKCVPYGSTGGNWDAFKCVPVLGDQAPGEACTYDGVAEATDTCDATSHCWNVQELEGEQVGTCTAFCTGTPDEPMCPEGYYCLIGSYGIPSLCLQSCDPIEQDCEDEDSACYWANGNFDCIFTTANIPIGEACGFINDCASGLACITSEVLPACPASACCSAFCNTTLGDEPCAELPDTVCEPWFEPGMELEGFEHVGICIVPQ